MSAVNLTLKYGTLASMPNTITNGTLRIATDVEKAFVDVNGIRVALGDVITSFTAAQITAITKANALPKIYMASDTFALYWFDTTAGEEDPETHVKPGAWKQVGANVAHAESADKDGAGNTITTTYETKEDATTKYNTLVAQIAAINSFEVQVVESLPVSDQDPHVLYFVRHNSIVTDPDYNVFDEYMWVIKTPASGDDPAVYGWELVGTTETDLTNYYTKTETDSIESAIYAALGVTKNEATASGFSTFDARLDALESTAGTDGGRIDELEAKFGDFNDSTAQGFTSVEARFQSIEGDVSTNASDITEINAKLGAMSASTTTGFQTVEQRLTTLESASDAADIAEIQAQLGSYPASTDTDFVSVADRFTADETNISTNASDISDLQTEVGAATNPDAASLRGRMAQAESDIDTAESDIDALQTEVGAAENPDAASLRGRMATAESDIDALQTEVGAASNPDAASLRGRMAQAETDIDTAEADIDEIQAQLGNYPASDATGFVSIEDRFEALESASDAADIAELQAKFGAFNDSTDSNFVSVEGRFTANETDISALQTEVGAASNPDASSLRGRMATAESDIDELEAKFGDFNDSTAQGFTSVEARFTADETAISGAEGDIDELQAQLGSYPASDATGFVSVADRFTADESSISALQTEVGAASNPDASSLRGRMATAESDIDELEAKFGTYAASTATGFTTVENRFLALESAVGNINRFEVQVIPDGQSLPVTGEQYTLYFVRHNSIPTDPDYNVFDEYMWVLKTPASTDPESGDPIPAVYGYELVGTTETDLTNYYTKTEMDAVIGDASTSGTIIYRIKTNEDAITEINAKLGNMAASTSQGFESVETRLSTLESTAGTDGGRITELEAKFGAYADSTDTSFASVESRFQSVESDVSTAQSDITELEAKFGAFNDSTDSNFASVEDRFTTDESAITEINAKLGNMADSTSTGFQTVEQRLSAIEGGAVTQSEDDDDAEKPVLVSGDANNTTVEYVPNVTVNAENGSVTAEQFKLGAATLVFNTTTGALEVNF